MTRPSVLRMLARGLIWRCPWCGRRRAFFTGWFAKARSCPGCGLHWRRGDVGFELGAASIAAVITLGALVTSLGVSLAVTWPDIAVVPLVVGLGAGAILLPLAIYPISYTVWQALDLAMRPVAAEDFAERAATAPDPS